MNGLLPNLGGYPQNPKRPCFQQYHQIEGMRWLWFDQCSLIASAARCWGRLNWRVGSCLSDLHNGSRSVGASVIHGGITELLNSPVINGIVKFWIVSLIRTCSRISAMEETRFWNKHSYIQYILWHTVCSWLFSFWTPALGLTVRHQHVNRSFRKIDRVRPS